MPVRKPRNKQLKDLPSVKIDVGISGLIETLNFLKSNNPDAMWKFAQSPWDAANERSCQIVINFKSKKDKLFFLLSYNQHEG